jgi:hypothetical protein
MDGLSDELIDGHIDRVYYCREAGEVTRYRDYSTGWTIKDLIPGKKKTHSLLHSPQA